MTQSTFTLGQGLHVAIIPDGNRRWAEERGRPGSDGHRIGLLAAQRIVPAAVDYGVSVLTIYGFAEGNWRRGRREVSNLMSLFRRLFRGAARACPERGVRVALIGRRDRLPRGLLAVVEEAEAATCRCSGMLLRIALDYSSRAAILDAADRICDGVTLSEDLFHQFLNHPSPLVPDVDLLIRTGGEQRLSDFLLWEIAQAELLFLLKRWPDFTPADLGDALREYQSRSRRCGGSIERPVRA